MEAGDYLAGGGSNVADADGVFVRLSGSQWRQRQLGTFVPKHR